MRRITIAATLLLASLGAASAQTLPPEIAARKTLIVALFASFPPMAYKRPEDNKLVGIDVDLADYFGKKLGVAIDWQDVSYEAATNALTTGRVDMSLSLLDLPEAADKLDFVDYMTSGMQVYALASHAPIPALIDICGLTVGANRRNGFDAKMRQWSDAHCPQAGRPPIKVMETDGTPAARLQLKQNRVDAIVQSSESVPYTMSLEPGVYMKVGDPFSSGLMIAMAFPKTSGVLRAAIVHVLKEAVADGSYAAILAKHGVEANSAAKEIAAMKE